MTRHLAVRVVLPRIDSDGRVRFAADLDVATVIARWAASGAVVQLRTGPPLGTPADWSGVLRRGAAHVLVVPAGPQDQEATWFADVLGAELASAGGLDDRLRCLLPEHTPGPGPGMPYQQRVLSVEAASEAGVDAESAAAVSEIEYLSGQGLSAARLVPLLRCPVDTGRWAAQRRTELIQTAAAGGLELMAVLVPEALTLSVAMTLRESGITRVRLEARPDAATAVRAAQVVAGSAHLTVTVRTDLAHWAGPAGVAARHVASLVQARPDTAVVASASRLRTLAAKGALAGVLPTSTLARTVREESRRGRAARERLVAGHYSDVPLVGGPHDLWWDHADQPHKHRDWLISLIPMGGHLHLSGDHDASDWTMPVPVSDHREITAYSRLDPGADGALAVLATPRCIADFVADAEAAWCSGEAPKRFLGAAVAGLCAVGAPCWAAGGRRLYIDRSGVVRCRPGGPAAGAVGDTFAQLRRRLRGAGCGPIGEFPSWMPRVLSAREALRGLTPTASQTQASGLGGPLLHSFASATEWPAGLALIRAGDRFLAHHAGQRTTAELSRAQAGALEVCLDLGPQAAAVLSELRSSPVTVEDVSHLVGSLILRLTSATPGAVGDSFQPTRRPATRQPLLSTADQG